MSTCHYIACHECRECLWIGQEGLSGFTFYSGQPETMTALGAFWKKHIFHRKEIAFETEHSLDVEPPYSEFEESLPEKITAQGDPET